MNDTGTLFWNQVIWSAPDLDATEVLLLLALADHVNAEDRCFPSTRTLAGRARCGYSTARRRLKVMTERGLIQREARVRKDGGQSTYEYRLLRSGFGLTGVDDPVLKSSTPPCSPNEHPPCSPGERAEVPIEVPSVEHSPSTDSSADDVRLFDDGAPSLEKPSVLEDEFEAWWRLVPRKAAKGNARKAFAKARKQVSLEVLVEAMTAFAESVKDREAKFIPHPASWLNAERWDDEIEDPEDGWDFGSGPRLG